jgi:dephospho-CoA kinase
MIKVGITGNIGSGKTTVSKIFETLNIPVYNSDLRARDILNSLEVVNVIGREWGSSLILDDGSVNRPELAKKVFADKKELEKLNAIIHPRVAEDFETWCIRNLNCDYILQEAAILIESGSYRKLDKLILVVAPVEIRMERVILRDKTNRDEVLKRMQNQMTEEDKRKYADYLINNDGDQSLIEQVLRIHNELKQ